MSDPPPQRPLVQRPQPLQPGAAAAVAAVASQGMHAHTQSGTSASRSIYHQSPQQSSSSQPSSRSVMTPTKALSELTLYTAHAAQAQAQAAADSASLPPPPRQTILPLTDDASASGTVMADVSNNTQLLSSPSASPVSLPSPSPSPSPSPPSVSVRSSSSSAGAATTPAPFISHARSRTHSSLSEDDDTAAAAARAAWYGTQQQQLTMCDDDGGEATRIRSVFDLQSQAEAQPQSQVPAHDKPQTKKMRMYHSNPPCSTTTTTSAQQSSTSAQNTPTLNSLDASTTSPPTTASSSNQQFGSPASSSGRPTSSTSSPPSRGGGHQLGLSIALPHAALNSSSPTITQIAVGSGTPPPHPHNSTGGALNFAMTTSSPPLGPALPPAHLSCSQTPDGRSSHQSFTFSRSPWDQHSQHHQQNHAGQHGHGRSSAHIPSAISIPHPQHQYATSLSRTTSALPLQHSSHQTAQQQRPGASHHHPAHHHNNANSTNSSSSSIYESGNHLRMKVAIPTHAAGCASAVPFEHHHGEEGRTVDDADSSSDDDVPSISHSDYKCLLPLIKNSPCRISCDTMMELLKSIQATGGSSEDQNNSEGTGAAGMPSPASTSSTPAPAGFMQQMIEGDAAAAAGGASTGGVASSPPSSPPSLTLPGGAFSGLYSKLIIIDARYPYEYAGGHIRGATNLWKPEQVFQYFLSAPPASMAEGQRICVVFHCEFSRARGPGLFDKLRGRDRDIHALKQEWSSLFYPEMYVLEGGYKAFYHKFGLVANSAVNTPRERDGATSTPIPPSLSPSPFPGYNSNNGNEGNNNANAAAGQSIVRCISVPLHEGGSSQHHHQQQHYMHSARPHHPLPTSSHPHHQQQLRPHAKSSGASVQSTAAAAAVASSLSPASFAAAPARPFSSSSSGASPFHQPSPSPSQGGGDAAHTFQSIAAATPTSAHSSSSSSSYGGRSGSFASASSRSNSNASAALPGSLQQSPVLSAVAVASAAATAMEDAAGAAMANTPPSSASPAPVQAVMDVLSSPAASPTYTPDAALGFGVFHPATPTYVPMLDPRFKRERVAHTKEHEVDKRSLTRSASTGSAMAQLVAITAAAGGATTATAGGLTTNTAPPTPPTRPESSLGSPFATAAAGAMSQTTSPVILPRALSGVGTATGLTPRLSAARLSGLHSPTFGFGFGGGGGGCASPSPGVPANALEPDPVDLLQQNNRWRRRSQSISKFGDRSGACTPSVALFGSPSTPSGDTNMANGSNDPTLTPSTPVLNGRSIPSGSSLTALTASSLSASLTSAAQQVHQASAGEANGGMAAFSPIATHHHHHLGLSASRSPMLARSASCVDTTATGGGSAADPTLPPNAFLPSSHPSFATASSSGGGLMLRAKQSPSFPSRPLFASPPPPAGASGAGSAAASPSSRAVSISGSGGGSHGGSFGFGGLGTPSSASGSGASSGQNSLNSSTASLLMNQSGMTSPASASLGGRSFSAASASASASLSASGAGSAMHSPLMGHVGAQVSNNLMLSPSQLQQLQQQRQMQSPSPSPHVPSSGAAGAVAGGSELGPLPASPHLEFRSHSDFSAILKLKLQRATPMMHDEGSVGGTPGGAAGGPVATLSALEKARMLLSATPVVPETPPAGNEPSSGSITARGVDSPSLQQQWHGGGMGVQHQRLGCVSPPPLLPPNGGGGSSTPRSYSSVSRSGYYAGYPRSGSVTEEFNDQDD